MHFLTRWSNRSVRPQAPPAGRLVSRRARWRWLVLRRGTAILLLSGAAIGVVRLAAPPAAETTTVVVAARDLPSGTVLTEADLGAQRFPREWSGPRLLRSQDAVGRRVSSSIARGEVLSPSRFVPRSAAEGLSPDLAAVHVLVVDPRSLEMAAPGLRVSLHDLDGALLATHVLVLSIDLPGPESGAGLGLGGDPAGGLVVALPREQIPQLLARRGLDPQQPTVHLVLEPGG